uniref:hypothetical protein n=1 Tax=Sphaerisporangium sp. CA-236357 TaxID=3240030 RepID=UPI003F4905A0
MSPTTTIVQVLPDRDRLALLQAEHAALVMAARASVAAAEQGQADPLVFVRAQLDRHGQLPPAGASPVELLAVAAAAALARKAGAA